MNRRLAVVMLTASVVASCGGGTSLPAPSCVGFTPSECQAITDAAAQGLSKDVRSRTLLSATIRRIDSTDPALCGDYGVCEPSIAAALVDLVYEGPRGPESWPVAVIKRDATAPFVAPKPFPGAQ